MSNGFTQGTRKRHSDIHEGELINTTRMFKD